MARLAGIEMNDNLRLVYALTRVNGIGWVLSKKILADMKVDEKTRLKDLGTDELANVNNALDAYVIEGDLARQIRGNIARLREIGTYRGIRHSRSLPVRGQRTRTNARTKRGKRKTIGAFKKEVLTKMTTNAKEEPKDGKK